MSDKNCINEMVCPEGHFVTVEPFNFLKEGFYLVCCKAMHKKEDIRPDDKAFYREGFMCYNCDRTYSREELHEINDRYAGDYSI